MNYDEKKLLYIAKNQLTYLNEDELLETYNTQDLYYNFIYMITILLEGDQLFLGAFPIAIDNILGVINKNRFELKTVGQVRELENEMIVALNKIKAKAGDEVSEKYRELQELLRMHSIETDEELAQEVSCDALVIKALEKDDEISIDREQFLSSTAFLIDEFPELYKNHPNNIKKTLDYIGIPNKDEPKYIQRGTKLVTKCLKKYSKYRKGE